MWLSKQSFRILTVVFFYRKSLTILPLRGILDKNIYSIFKECIMTLVTIGLTFPGTCEQAFTLYKSVFGVEFDDFIRYGQDPSTDATTPCRTKIK